VLVAKRPSKLEGLRKPLRWVKVGIQAMGLVRRSRGGGRLKKMRELGEGCITAGKGYLQRLDIARRFH